MMAKAAADVIRFVANAVLFTCIIGVLMAGGVAVKLWRNRP